MAKLVNIIFKGCKGNPTRVKQHEEREGKLQQRKRGQDGIFEKGDPSLIPLHSLSPMRQVMILPLDAIQTLQSRWGGQSESSSSLPSVHTNIDFPSSMFNPWFSDCLFKVWSRDLPRNYSPSSEKHFIIRELSWYRCDIESRAVEIEHEIEIWWVLLQFHVERLIFVVHPRKPS